MISPASLSPNIEVFQATPEGLELLESSEQLQSLVTRFGDAEHYAHNALYNPDRSMSLGTGANAEVWRVDGVAVKASTPMSGKEAKRIKEPVKPEDLIGQFDFMRALGIDLKQRGHDDVIVPEQYFALRSQGSDYLLAQQYMEGWQSVGTWAADRGYGIGGRNPEVIFNPLRNRLRAALGSSALKRGVNDMGIWGSSPFHGGNLLMQRDSDSLEGPLCIIDQPSRGLRAKMGIAAARKILSRQQSSVSVR